MSERNRFRRPACRLRHANLTLPLAGRSALMSRPDYRPFLPKPGQSKIAGPTARAHANTRRQSPRAQEFFAQWAKSLAEPFKGITADGNAVPGLYKLEPNGAPVAA